MSNSHSTAYYWSHAGQHFEIRDEGDWCVRWWRGAGGQSWGGLPLHLVTPTPHSMGGRQQVCLLAHQAREGSSGGGLIFTWCAPGAVSRRWSAVPDEDWPTEDASRELIVADWAVEEGGMGDRRQEIVFIGVGMDQAKISEQVRRAEQHQGHRAARAHLRTGVDKSTLCVLRCGAVPRLSSQLDSALLTDEEMDKYKARWAAVPDPTHPSVDEAIKAKRAKLEHHHHHHHHHHH